MAHTSGFALHVERPGAAAGSDAASVGMKTLSSPKNGPLELRNACPVHHDVECRPRLARALGAKKVLPCSFPIRVLLVLIPVSCGDQCKNTDAARAEQF